MKKDQESENYWQSNTDILSALLLVIMLVAVVLILYLMDSPADIRGELTPTPAYSAGGLYTPAPTPEHTGRYDDDSGYGGGGDETPQPTLTITPEVTVTPTPTPTVYMPGGGGFGDEEDEDKVAVYVLITDSETGRVIPEADIGFVLYDGNRVRQTLNTYYPQRIRYTDFVTTEDGVFYLPEKVPSGSYSFANLNAPAGYYIADDHIFTAEHDHDWPEPNVVRIPFDPIKSTVRISLTDRNTGIGLEGSSFSIIAAEDIFTSDGTLRCRKGEIADTVVTGEDGRGESILLYPGYYDVVMDEAPLYYAGGLSEKNVRISGDVNGPVPADTAFSTVKTAVLLTVRDELYAQRLLEDVPFEVLASGSAAVSMLSTDASGRLLLTDLDKDSVYRFTQTGAPDGYLFDDTERAFSVDENGLIDGEPEYILDITNRMIRVSVQTRDAVFGNEISGVAIGLYDMNGNQIRLWTSSALAENVENLPVGQYRLILNGENGSAKTITVRDTADRQDFSYGIWTATDISVIAGGALVLILIAVLLIRRRARK
ncbi:MAG: SpaA isopeptide-forming pilin-related protein [Clostridia bacterium]|nr:SpaA isopeptide-forming pilin-related protein [Clostridia bacterium]